jgi:hypothetical protein
MHIPILLFRADVESDGWRKGSFSAWPGIYDEIFATVQFAGRLYLRFNFQGGNVTCRSLLQLVEWRQWWADLTSLQPTYVGLHFIAVQLLWTEGLRGQARSEGGHAMIHGLHHHA